MKYTRLLENLTESSSLGSIGQSDFVSLLAKHKAILFQSDDSLNEPFTLLQFGKFLSDLNLNKYSYVGGAAPRRIVEVETAPDLVYTANEAPPNAIIPFHHELAQVKNPPQFLFFYCEIPPITGGETFLMDSTLVYRYASDNFPDFMKKLEKCGARYTRVMPTKDDLTSPLGRSFYNCYQVSSVEELETKLDAIDGLEYEWLSDGSLKVTTEPIPAVRMITQEHNHAVYQYTFHNSVIAAFFGWEDSRNDRFKAVKFGNNDEMDPVVLASIGKFMEENKVSYKWKRGDFFALNNQLVMHSRNAYSGPRRVLAAMFGDIQGTIGLKSALSVQNPLTFGFWRLNNPEKTAYNAIKAGYRRLDSACDYGNEISTGLGIKRALMENICKREDLYITTKLWNTYHDPVYVPLALEKSLQDLGLDYVDEFLIHFPISMQFVPFDKKYPPEWTNLDGKMIVVNNDINETWKAMEQLVMCGKTRHVGLSNFNCQHIRQILSIATIKPTSLQIECHPHNSQEKLIRFARNEGIRCSVFSPLGGNSYISLNMATQCDVLFHNRCIENISKKHNKTSAQIMLRWAVQRNTLPICKSSSKERMTENQALFDFFLHKEDMDAIDSLNLNKRYNDPGVFCEEAFGTFCPIYE